MKIEERIIEEFRQGYFEIFGEEITTEEAQEKLMRLARYLRAINYPNSN